MLDNGWVASASPAEQPKHTSVQSDRNQGDHLRPHRNVPNVQIQGTSRCLDSYSAQYVPAFTALGCPWTYIKKDCSFLILNPFYLPGMAWANCYFPLGKQAFTPGFQTHKLKAPDLRELFLCVIWWGRSTWILDSPNDYGNQKSIMSQYRFSYCGKYHGIKYFLHLGYPFSGNRGDLRLVESFKMYLKHIFWTI